MLIKIGIGASFLYGCHRGWTLPKWYNMSYKSRLGFTFVTGIKYIIPPFCIIKYIHLCIRVWNYNKGSKYCAYPPWDKYIYGEWGFYHPRVF